MLRLNDLSVMYMAGNLKMAILTVHKKLCKQKVIQSWMNDFLCYIDCMKKEIFPYK